MGLARAGLSSTRKRSLTITKSTLSGNTARGGVGYGYYGSGFGGSGEGGAIFNAAQGLLTVTNSTLTGNLAAGGGGFSGYYGDGGGDGDGWGGAIGNEGGSATFFDATIAANSVTGVAVEGSGIYNGSGLLAITNTIVADGTSAHDIDVIAGTVTGGTNLVPSSLGVPAGVITVTSPPLLAPLAYYGGQHFGQTPTMALLPGSPAIGAAVVVPGISTDRGASPGDRRRTSGPFRARPPRPAARSLDH